MNVSQLQDKFHYFERQGVKPINDREAYPDLVALNVIARLLPNCNPLTNLLQVDEYEEQIRINIALDDLAHVITNDDIETLVRCGVYFGEDDNCDPCLFLGNGSPAQTAPDEEEEEEETTAEEDAATDDDEEESDDE